MTYKLLYFEEVDKDIEIAKLWYKNQKEGLEVKFSKSVERSLVNIIDGPKRFAIRYKNVRIAHTKIFPYNIYYFIDEINLTVVVIAIVHGRRNQKIIEDRI